MNTISFDKISFPVYHLGRNKPEIENGLAYFYYTQHHKTGEVTETKTVVDDKNQSGGSLAMRRLQLKQNGVNLHKLKYALFFISDLIKMTKMGSWFIDSEGQIFEYAKTKRVPLVFRPITQLIPIKTGGCIVEVRGEGNRFKTLHAPKGFEKYAGLLLVGTGSILYGLYSEKLQDTVRMV